MRLTIAANTLSQLIGKFIGAGTTVLVSILLVKKFGMSGYGDFIKVTTYISFFFLIADFGLNAIYLQKQKEPHAFSRLLSTRIMGGIFLVFLSLAILAFLPQGTTDGYTTVVRFGIILFSPAIFFHGLITTANAIFQKHLRYDLATVALAAGSALTVGVLLVLLQTPVGATIVGPLGLISGSIVTAAVALWAVKKLEGLSYPAFSLRPIGALMRTAFPLGLTLFFTLIYGHIDSVILTLTRTTSEVGVYGLAYKVFELALVFPTFFMNAVYPIMLQATGDRRQVILKKSFWLLLLVSCLLSLVTWLCAPLLAHIQQDFAASITPLRILSLSLPFFFISALTMWVLIALRKQLLLASIYGLAMIINIFLNLWLIPPYGYIAAAWTTVIGEGLVLALSSFFVLRYIRTL